MDLDDIDKWSRELLQKEARKRGYINASMYSRPELIRLILRHDYASARGARATARSLFDKAKSALKHGFEAASHAARAHAKGEAVPPGPYPPAAPRGAPHRTAIHPGAREGGSPRSDDPDPAPAPAHDRASAGRAGADSFSRDDGDDLLVRNRGSSASERDPEPDDSVAAEPRADDRLERDRASDTAPVRVESHAWAGERERDDLLARNRGSGTAPARDAAFTRELHPDDAGNDDLEREDSFTREGSDSYIREHEAAIARPHVGGADFGSAASSGGAATEASDLSLEVPDADPAPERRPARSMFPAATAERSAAAVETASSQPSGASAQAGTSPPSAARSDSAVAPPSSAAATNPAHVDPTPELRPPALDGAPGSAPQSLELQTELTNAQLAAAANPVSDARTISARVDPSPELRPPAKDDRASGSSGLHLVTAATEPFEYGSSPWSIRPAAAKQPAPVIPLDRGQPPTAAEPSGADRLTYAQTEHGLMLRWQVSADGVERARAVLGSPGELAVRIVAVRTDDHALVHTEVLDHGPIENRGDWTAPLPPTAARYVSSIGLRTPERFVSIVHAST